MKTILIALVLFAGISTAIAQDVNARLNQANSAYESGKLDDARFELQSALVEIDKVIGAEILKMLPTAMDELPYVEENDNVTGTGESFVGLYVNRTYGNADKTAEILIISDSPLMASINTLLTMPLMLNTDPNQKRIKVDGYKALMQKNEGEGGNISWDVQIPFGSSLLTFTVDGISDETKVETLANSIPVTKIAALTK